MESEKQSSKRSKKWIIILGVLVVLCLLVAVAGMGGGENRTTTPTAQPVAEKAVSADTPAPPTTMPEQEPTAVPEPSAAPNVGQVGERREAGGVALTVLGVSKIAQVNEIMKADAGNTFVVLGVLIENTGKEESPYNPLYFSLKDGEGFQYQNAILAPNPALQSGTLPQGDKVRGNVAFQVKEGASGLVVTYEPLVLAGGYEPIRVALGE